MKNIGTKLQLLKMKCGHLGLWETMHALDDATKFYIKDIIRIHKASMKSEARKKVGK